MRAITDIGTIEIQRSQQELWRSGRLAPEWAHRFPELFDEDDLRLAESQGYLGYHFCEWLAAIVLHHATGHLALVSKYEFRSHPRKQGVVQRLLAPELRAAISDRTKQGLAQAPDLLMYAPDLSDWFFCEVKGPGDRLQPEQRAKFEGTRGSERKADLPPAPQAGALPDRQAGCGLASVLPPESAPRLARSPRVSVPLMALGDARFHVTRSSHMVLTRRPLRTVSAA